MPKIVAQKVKKGGSIRRDKEIDHPKPVFVMDNIPIVCTDFSGKEPDRHVGVESVYAPGSV